MECSNGFENKGNVVSMLNGHHPLSTHEALIALAAPKMDGLMIVFSCLL